MWRLGGDPVPWGEVGRGVTEIRSVCLATSGLTSPSLGGVPHFPQPTSTLGHLETSGSYSLDLRSQGSPSSLNPWPYLPTFLPVSPDTYSY